MGCLYRNRALAALGLAKVSTDPSLLAYFNPKGELYKALDGLIEAVAAAPSI